VRVTTRRKSPAKAKVKLKALSPAGSRPAAGAARRPLRVGVIGLGFMGRMHVAAYRAADAAGLRNKLVAVCDPDPARRAGRVPAAGNMPLSEAPARLFDPRQVEGHERPEELLARDDLDLVSICTWTESHVELALAALAAGKHVLVEKPVALRERAAARLAAAARAAGTLCMPAMCMRFWPGWSLLREAVADGRWGAARSAVFRRLGSRPPWASGFYGDGERSGGALFDLHVHDADLVLWLFGPPLSVQSSGTPDHLSTLYRYDTPGPLHVTAEAGWDHDPAFPFRMAYTVVFERGTADFDSSRERPLRLYRDGVEQTVELPAGTGYEGEVQHLLAAIGRNARSGGLLVSCDDAVAVTRLLGAEERSLRSGLPVEL
jgi:1,5-anhydro-D-fructose reductase (1,5-anhydro-D-mannitol-forming)